MRLIHITIYSIFSFLLLFNLAEAKNISLSPAKLEVEMAPGESRQENFTIANETETTLNFAVGLQDLDFTAGQLTLVEPQIDPSPFSLVPYLTPGLRTFRLEPGQKMITPLTISLPVNASPGSLHASVSFTASKAGATGSSVASRLGGLVLVRVLGEAIPDGELVSFSRAPTEELIFNLTFENYGNVYLNPYGLIELTNLKTDQTVTIEIDPWFVLPATTRTRQIEWSRSAGLTPGNYQAKIKLNRGYGSIIDEEVVEFKIDGRSSFWIYLIALALGVGLGLWSIIRRRKYKRS